MYLMLFLCFACVCVSFTFLHFVCNRLNQPMYTNVKDIMECSMTYSIDLIDPKPFTNTVD